MVKIIVCVRQGLDGEISPFDASAYEAALRFRDAEVTLLSMAPSSSQDFLLRLTRLGAKKAVLLNDKAFAGSDTLATAYVLSLAIKRLGADLVICGRQTLIGDTGQTGPMLAAFLDISLVTGVMGIDQLPGGSLHLVSRSDGDVTITTPALLCVEKIHTLRLPRLRSVLGELEILSASDVGADISRCGLGGSPTRVLASSENQSGKRKCRFISMDQIFDVIRSSMESYSSRTELMAKSEEKLKSVCIVGEAQREFAESITNNVSVISSFEVEEIIREIKDRDPDAVLWATDDRSKKLAATVAARLGLGLCADCTALGCEDENLTMYRPALSGSVIAKIKSTTRPAMATVRTESRTDKDIIVTAGFGVKDCLSNVKDFAESLGAQLCATRKLVDNGYASYDMQIGLTGKRVSPPIYIAVGVSGAVHHIAGMERSGTVIAINPDKDAPIFEYADFGVIGCF